MTEYEVKCPQTWAWYTGYVHDYNEREKKLYIKYADDWKSPELVDVTSVREKYDVSSASSWRPSYNEEVECKARAEEGEPYGWWPCKAQPYKSGDNTSKSDDLYSVAFLGWGNEHNEILGIEFIRKKSSSSIVIGKNLYREVYLVPREVCEWVTTHCANNTILDTLMPHKNISSQIMHIAYLEKESKLLLIGVKRVLLTMKDIIYCFFEKQKSLLKLEQKTTELELKSKRKKEEELKAEKYTFNVHPLLSGYLRGKKGTNIDQAMRRNNKIIRIEPQNGSCYIAAKDKRSLNAAIDSLHVVCKKVVIPKHEMGQIIGSQGQQIQDIKRKSQVIKVISWKLWPKEFNTLREIQTKRYKSQSYANNDEGLEEDEAIPDIIKNATLDNIFEEDDIIDLSQTSSDLISDMNQNFPLETNTPTMAKDALVIIGRKSRVALCIFMIEMALNHFRQITKTRNNVRALRQKINEIKGNPVMPYNRDRPRRGGRDRGGRDRGGRGGRGGRGTRNREYYDNEQKENSPHRETERERETERDRGDKRNDRDNRGSRQRERGGRGPRNRRRRRDRDRNRDRDRERELEEYDNNNQSNEQQTYQAVNNDM
eukprot:114721_1